MFEHLDDPTGLGPTDRLRTAVVRRGRRRRRARRLAWGGTAAIVAVAGSALAAYAYLDRRIDRVDRVHVAGLAPEPLTGEPYTVLFRGLDDVSSLPADDRVRDGRDDVVGARADTLVLARIEPGRNRITTLAVPRDLLVGGPTADGVRINQLSLDGAVAAIRSELGIEVHRVVETDLGGAVAIADAVGGLRLAFERPVRDVRSGLDLAAGCGSLDGAEALALGRSRHLEELRDGTWTVDPTGDLGRIARLEPVAVAGAQALARLDLSSPGAVAALLDAVAAHATIDSRWTRDDLVDLARHVAGSEVRHLTLPIVGVTVDGAELVEPGPAGPDVVDAFLSGVDAPASMDDSPTVNRIAPVRPIPC